MSKTGGQETFQQAAQQVKATTTNNKKRAREFSEAVQAKMKNTILTKEEEV
jgi:hypothetical protein